MSMQSYQPPLPPPPPPPMPLTITQQPHVHHSAHGSVGSVVAVLVVIIFLSALAVMIGRLCSRRKILIHGRYDVESWMETKCSACVDGRITPSPPPPSSRPNVSVPARITGQTQEETRSQEQPQ